MDHPATHETIAAARAGRWANDLQHFEDYVVAMTVLLEGRATMEAIDRLRAASPKIFPTVVFMALWDSRARCERRLAWRTETGVSAELVGMLEAPPNTRCFEQIDAESQRRHPTGRFSRRACLQHVLSAIMNPLATGQHGVARTKERRLEHKTWQASPFSAPGRCVDGGVLP